MAGDGDGAHESSDSPIVIENEEASTKSIHENLSDLSEFKVTKVLHTNTERKTICLQGTFGDNEHDAGIVLLEKTAFEEEKLKTNKFFSEGSVLQKQFHNDIYGNYECLANASFNGIKTTIIHPATQHHIEKYSVKNVYIVDETPEIYKHVVLPHLLEDKFNLQWVYNILDHKSETERIVIEDPDPKIGFILLPDLKWDGVNLETLYLLAIVNLRDIKSIRDLRHHHLDLLRNVRDLSKKAIQDKYGIDPSKLRIYFHYEPSFYHLHVHFTNLSHNAPGIFTERAHMLANVISNLELLPDYYEKVTLPVVVFENSKLFERFEKKGILNKA